MVLIHQNTGDSGGPLLLPANGCGEEDSLWGIVSGGVDCFDRFGQRTLFEAPGVYTRVSSFSSWINSLPGHETIVYRDPTCNRAPPRQLGYGRDMDQEMPTTDTSIVKGANVNPSFGVALIRIGLTQYKNVLVNYWKRCTAL